MQEATLLLSPLGSVSGVSVCGGAPWVGLTSLQVGCGSSSVQPAHLGQLRLGETRLAHLGGLAHGDVALGQGPLREGLRCYILAGLAAGQVRLAGPRKAKPVLLASTTTCLAFRGASA